MERRCAMKELVTCRQMKERDRFTIQEHQIPSLVLMERAACAAAEQLEKRDPKREKILCACGMGNNGGDGIAIARILFCKGYDCAVYLVGDRAKMTQETRQQTAIAESYGVPFVNNPDWMEYTTIVDALFGIGLTRKAEGDYAEAIQKINQSPAWRLAVDIPSGINGDTGQVLGEAVRADETVTFAYGKPGLYLYPGCRYAGTVHVADIGIYGEKGIPASALLEEADIDRWLPDRDPGGNKGTFGKVLVLASQKNMAGAGYLCASACFATGAGMVKLHTAEDNRVIYQSILPEAMVTAQRSGAPDLELLRKDIDWCDVVATGPGLGTGEDSRILLEYLLQHCRKPMVLDADALNLISRNAGWKDYLGRHCVLTPHIGEMSRLAGVSAAELKENSRQWAETLQRETGAVCVLKDASTWIAAGDGTTYLNCTGNDGMATAGSGDVLCGVIAGELAAGLSPGKAAALGVCLHGAAGEEARQKKGTRGMLARDIVQGVSCVLKRKEDKKKR